MVMKAVPRDKLDEIIQRYGCTEEEALRAYLEAKKTYDETLHDTLGATAEEKARAAQGPISHTPAEIKEHLDKYVIGQEVYKKRLAIAAAYHFAIVKGRKDHPDLMDKFTVKRWRKKNTLIAGPSGSGKTYCVEILGDMLGVPVNVVDATDYTEAGYVGKNADDMVRELIAMAPGENKQEKADFINRYGGLIFVDEMDKKAKEGNLIGTDVSREGFQRAVLKLVERKFVSIDDPNSPASQIQDIVDQQRGIAGKKKKTMISTENILFILGGSFQRPHDSMEQIVKKRLTTKSGRVKDDGSLTVSGFTLPDKTKKPELYRNYYRDATEEDYIRFGIIPELVGRAPIRTYVNALSKNDLVRIMTETADSILNQYKLEFNLFGIDLSFTKEAIDTVAERAEEKRTGARALVSEWETVLTDFQYELPGREFREFTVTKAICHSPQDELMKLFEKSPVYEFISRFKREHGVQLRFTEGAVAYVEQYAKDNRVQISDALDKLMAGAPALNYMDVKGEFEVTEEVLSDEKYFDKLYVQWHRKQLGEIS